MKILLLSLSMFLGLLSISQPNDKVLSVYVDEFGTVWCGTDDGMLKKTRDIWSSFKTIEGGNGTITLGQVNSLAPQFTEYGSEFWAATNNGATVESYDVDGYTGATNYTFESSNIASDSIKHVMLDENDFRYFSTDSGLSVFAGRDFYLIKDLASMGGENSFNASASSNDTIFIASGRGVGIVAYDEVDGFTGATTWQLPYQYGLPSDYITSVFISDDNSQWFGTDKGVAKHTGYNGKADWILTLTGTVLENANVNVIAEDSAHNIWLGTDGGLVKLDYDINSDNYESKITILTTVDGLPSNVINAIYVVNNVDMWIGTDLGPCLLSNEKPVQIDDLSSGGLPSIIAYPNPVTDILTVDFNTVASQKVECSIYSLTGSLLDVPFSGFVNKGSKITISTSEYRTGVYILRVEADSFNQTIKINKF